MALFRCLLGRQDMFIKIELIYILLFYLILFYFNNALLLLIYIIIYNV